MALCSTVETWFFSLKKENKYFIKMCVVRNGVQYHILTFSNPKKMFWRCIVVEEASKKLLSAC